MSLREPVLLFDLGGVLVEVAPANEMLRSLGLPVEEPLLSRWVAMSFWERFEIGGLAASEFAEQFIEQFSLRLAPDQVLEEFEAWNRRLLPGVRELLTELRERHRLAVLTNTNEVHWKRLSGEFDIPGLVDAAFASHLIGLRKPDQRIYHHVADELGVKLNDLVFFDDNPHNVNAALSLGMQAWQVEGVTALRERLTALGYL